ncbi:MAG: ATP-binding cassette domain-containing protein [Propionibacteriaceae bacterium]|nr:ATP-binding cassette domain-containing protein [Propionibacteriaceae bacterium]
MLHLEEVRKTYHTGTFTQAALDGVSVTFRDNEFVAILGPSGSGKTTMLNVVGGLDHCDSGDLVIDDVSTQQYSDRDWDTYRNNRIGFVFQNYNLIPHQTVLANVELALTLSGVSKADRTQRAKIALEQVDLGEHLHKKPNQLSGGQMQRVAIARALINDPEILLADEPTGALDSKTGVHVMNLLADIAQERLVIMVTHNPELAEEYATRTISLRDGRVVGDTDPYTPPRTARTAKKARRTSMSFLTAIALSFKNLMTKKGRTLMTSFAGSIGIVGIATILALANGVNAYIRGVEEDTLSLYPLQIQTQGIDMASMLTAGQDLQDVIDNEWDSDVHEVKVLGRMLSEVSSNDLKSLKKYLDSEEAGIDQHVRSIQYNYNVTPQIFHPDVTDTIRQVNPNTMFSSLGFGGDSSSAIMSMGMTANVFGSLPEDMNLVTDSYEVLAGHWPSSPGELVLVTTNSGGISDFVLYAMGLRDPAELEQMLQDMAENKTVSPPKERLNLSYSDILDVTFKQVNAARFYEYDPSYNVWSDRSKDDSWMRYAVTSGNTLRVVGVVTAGEDASGAMLRPGLYYPMSLVYQLMDQASKSDIVIDQLKNPDVNVFSGKTFDEEAENPGMGDFDFSTLLDIDTDSLASMFDFDFSGLSIPANPSMGSMDMSSMSGSMPQVPPPDLGAMLSGMSIEISEDALADLLTQTVGDYLRDTLGSGTPGLPQLPQAPGLTPTNSPTAQPAPSPEPTSEPTPSGEPSQGGEPTSEPTQVPTQLPTEIPTTIPTDLPTEIPTTAPSLPGDIGGSFAAWFNQPQNQAVFMGRLMNAINTDQLEAQASQALAGYMQSTMEMMVSAMMGNLSTQLGAAMQSTMTQIVSQLSSAMSIDPQQFADIFQFNSDPEQFTSLLMSMMSRQRHTLDSNLQSLGYATLDNPYSIDIYPNDFAAKQAVIDSLDAYNERMKVEDEDKVITFTDIVGTLMTSVTDIIDKISAVLVAFVSISLVVSSIMIGVITYISVLERRKEIGILRALGASKRDIGNVFNAETLIVGFVAGVMGVLITLGIILIANPIVYALTDVDRIARLPFNAAMILIGVSMLLTFLAGLIPSSAASRKDPVEALRSE